MMNELDYLQDAKWIKERNKEWKQHEYDQLYAFSPEELKGVKDYCFTGDVDQFISRISDHMDKHPEDPKEVLSTVIKYCPFNDLSMVLDNIAKFWFWALEKPEERFYEYKEGEDLDVRFSKDMGALFSRQFLDDKVSTELFFWLYGELYDPRRKVQLSYDDKTIEINVRVDINGLSAILIEGIVHNLIYPQDMFKFEENKLYTKFIAYFLSIYMYVSKECYSTAFPEGKDFKSIRMKGFNTTQRWLLCVINGHVTEYEEFYDIAEIQYNDEEAFQKLKNGIAELDMPKEFYELEKFVLKHKGESFFISE